MPAGAVGGVVAGIFGALVIAAAVVGWNRCQTRKKVRSLKVELEKFKESVVGVRHVAVGYDPSGGGAAPAGGGNGEALDLEAWKRQVASKLHAELALTCEATDIDRIAKEAAATIGIVLEGRAAPPETAAVLSEVGKAVLGADAPPMPLDAAEREATPSSIDLVEAKEDARWFWKEDAANLSVHNPADVEGEFVAYAGAVCAELNEKWHAYTKLGGAAVVQVDLHGRIGSTGGEKAHNAHTGVVFEIDLKNLQQKNVTSGFTREIMRIGIKPGNDAPAPPPPPTSSAQPGRDSRRSSLLRRRSSGVAAPASTLVRSASQRRRLDLPEDLAGEDLLILHEEQLIQTSRRRPDGWTFGHVCYDKLCPDGRPASRVDGFSTSAGWLREELTEVATAQQLRALQELLGGGDNASDALKPPPEWEPQRDPMATQFFTLPEGPEKAKVVATFMRTLTPAFRVQSVERVQNVSMWQSYAVKRQTILLRESPDNPEGAAGKCEHRALFHGTDQDTVPKIATSGFNRSFCGKNATMFGKGVYFARDASYSSSTTYAKPNSKGVQHMFLCRVVVGVYCQGKKDALTPDVRRGHQLYDTTVDDTRNPTRYVTYHDAQAYPDYLIKFKQ